MPFKIITAAWIVALLGVAAVAARQQGAAGADSMPVIFDGNYMESQIITQVDPDYPWGSPGPKQKCTISFTVIIGTDGRVKEARALGDFEPFTSAARKAVLRWRWKPQTKNGIPVVVQTGVYVVFDPETAGNGSPVSIVDTDESSSVSIVLKSGSTIHADTMQKQGENVQYSIGEDSYEIPNSLVEKVISKPPPASPKHGTASPGAPGVPPPAVHDIAFESTAELRQACDSQTFKYPEHAELGKIRDVCGVLEAKMAPSYEEEVDRAVRLEQTLCAAEEGPVTSQSQPKDARLVGLWEGFQNVYIDIQNYRTSMTEHVAYLRNLGRQDNETRQAEDEYEASKRKTRPLSQEEIQRRADEAAAAPPPPLMYVPDSNQATLDRIERVGLDMARLTVVCKGPQNRLR